MFEDIQEFMSPYMRWITLIMLLLGALIAFVPSLASPSVSGMALFPTAISVLAAVEVLYAILYGFAEGFDFKEEKILVFALGGFALFSSGMAAITGAIQLLGPLAPLATAFQVPLVAIGGSMLLLAFGGYHNLTK